ncbi:MAG: peptidoglycan-binding protein [Sulfobacillus benefaciens]|uniref:Peptidoglycan-binding protein n=1 Tax=Sulfobacillus benefaciens TaxID=453960 RepID=A0A2T2XEV8_9FIRM|nr:MAG: peptidoglycan-binding protein [Sulfobacillus benefaciens]
MAKQNNLMSTALLIGGAVVVFLLWKNGTLTKWFGSLFGGTAQNGASQTTTQEQGSSQATQQQSASSGASSQKTAAKTSTSAAGGGTYTVQSGESLSSIAAKFGVSLSALENANPQITNPNLIYPNESINLPSGAQSAGSSGYTGSGTPGYTQSDAEKMASQTASLQKARQVYQSKGTSVSVSSNGTTYQVQHTSQSQPKNTTYTVQSGNTLSAIASANGMSLQELLALNPSITDPNLIYPGQKITVRGSGSTGSVSSTTDYSTQRQTGGGTLINVRYRPQTHTSNTSETVRVQSGQSLSAIAAAHGISLAQIEAMNHQISNFNLIYPGEEVHI